MKIDPIAFETMDWSTVAPTEHAGVTGKAYWRTRQFGAIRVRMVEFTPGYVADHWCEKGHILLCLEGEMETELSDGSRFVLKPGMSYHVGDGISPHMSRAEKGARLFIVD